MLRSEKNWIFYLKLEPSSSFSILEYEVIYSEESLLGII